MASATAPIISATGISAPSYADVLSYLKTTYQSIYGLDTYLENDSQDGQFIAVLALAISDANAATLAAYLAFSPVTAQGAGLSSNVKINGISRGVPSNSQADLTLVGQAGTVINQGLAQDSSNNQWALPQTVVIPPSGSVVATATCTTPGTVIANVGQINQITTATLGWQSVTNLAAATPGAPVETDAALRQRQQLSVALPSRTVLEGTTGAVASVPGVTRYATYDNSSNLPDSNGIPPHSMAIVVEGGDAVAIAAAIADKKGPGGGTYGTTSQVVADIYGTPITINFFRPSVLPITCAVTLKALVGYTSATGAALQQAIASYVNQVPIGGGVAGAVEWADAITVANSVANSATFKLTGLVLSGGGVAGVPDVPLAFNQSAACVPASIVLTVT